MGIKIENGKIINDIAMPSEVRAAYNKLQGSLDGIKIPENDNEAKRQLNKLSNDLVSWRVKLNQFLRTIK